MAIARGPERRSGQAGTPPHEGVVEAGERFRRQMVRKLLTTLAAAQTRQREKTRIVIGRRTRRWHRWRLLEQWRR